MDTERYRKRQPAVRARFAACGVAVTVVVVALGSAASALAAPCTQPSGRPWCAPGIAADARARLLTDALTPGEKLRMLAGVPRGRIGSGGVIAGVPRLGIPQARVAGSTVGAAPAAGSDVPATQMPSPSLLAASFDVGLARRAGTVVGREARSRGSRGLLGPAADVMRVPLAGRAWESFGEDPDVNGAMAAAWIRGAESAGVFTSLKHFAVNTQEGAGLSDERLLFGLSLQGNRYWYNAVVSERALREIYLAPFEEAIREGRPGSVMCAYNRVNGQHACANRRLLTDILRREWGYDGLVMSDWFLATHPRDTVAQLRNGLDLEMPWPVSYNPALVRPLLRLGMVSWPVVDAHVRRILRATIEAGLLDDEPPERPAGADPAAAQEVAEGGIVLLRNTGVLPLKDDKSVAVLGPAARRSASGGGSGSVTPPQTVTVADALTARGGDVVVDDTRDPARAAAVARSADVAVVVVRDYEGEGADRACLDLSCQRAYGDQDALIEAVAAAQPNTIVVLQTGAPVLTPWRDRVAALVQAWYPGMSGGSAIARVLFGDVDPSGRLPMTFPARAEDLPTAGSRRRYPGDATQNVFFDEGVLVGYRWFDAMQITPAYPFGYGLSYTTFAYSDLVVRPNGVSFHVRNTGARRGAAVPQLYVGLATAGEPPWQLRGFAKVWLDPGESRAVTLPLTDRDLSWWNGGWRREPCAEVAVGASSRDVALRSSTCR